MGTALVNARFTPENVKLLDMSCSQALILLAFNDNESLSYAQIKEITGLSENEVKRQLVALTMADHQVLIQTSLKPEETKGGDSKKVVRRAIGPQDTFEVNTLFSAKLKRIAINQMQKKESHKETEEVHEKVLSDRKYLIDAAVVRTMKARLRLSQTDLIAEVIKLVRFPLDIAVLKQRLECLIDSDYMRRDDNDRALFHYVA